MHRRRWLIIGLCFCAFTGCVSCQNNYDYCGPMPDEGGDFLFRKNSVLGGDPNMPSAIGNDADKGQQADTGEGEPEPTPAPPPDEEPMPGLDLDESLDSGLEMAPGDGDSEAPLDEASDDEGAEEDAESEADEGAEAIGAESGPLEQPVSTLQWHAPRSPSERPSIKQVRFR